MDALFPAFLLLSFLILALGMGLWVFAGLLLVTVFGLGVIADFSPDRIGVIARSVLWKSATTWELAAIPLFIWMGEIIFRTDISERLFRGLAPLVEGIPGRLLHTNVMGCTLFAAMSGSTAATTATIGKITTTALAERKYYAPLAVGSLAGAGSLGLLIPPSIVMIIYGVLAEVSIARLFAAGVLPGLMLAALFSGYIMLQCVLHPQFAPKGVTSLTFAQLGRSFVDLLPIFALIVIVLGGIYSGLATPSEAAALGVGATILLTYMMRCLTLEVLVESLMSAVRTSCMVVAILMAAALLSSTMGYLHIPMNIANAIAEANFSPLALLLMLAAFYIVLGLFLDGISIVVMSLPITLPIVVQAGYDPLWFGVFLVLMVEMGMITPPVGFNLFVIQGLTGQPLGEVSWAAFPFFLVMCLAVAILAIEPRIALFLPSLMP
ncbi:TRAP transporter large permease [Rhodoligotrophos defluvii]|uniref:TRAP transporter large permease n=1 Tax=Rhodoligotrophos defluvii TaxID=2561934 RepID=UPI001960AD92|nr:TRAP transporter large permease subunit [Rhodoligotrophos defluvii]